MLVYRKTALIFFVIICVYGCRKSDFSGSFIANKPPETFLVADSILRTGNNRLSSTVSVRWSGFDPDGTVTGFYISSDNINWNYTTRKDSVLQVQIPAGMDTFDLPFFVKAVDIKGLVDPSPARLTYPLKNSPPNIKFIIPNSSSGIITRNPIRNFPVLKYSFEISDPDGINDLDGIELVLNDTLLIPVNIDPSVKDITLIATNPGWGNTDAYIYTGSSLKPLTYTIKNFFTRAVNVLYIRSRDKVGAVSPFIASTGIYTKPVLGKILMINSISSISNKSSIQNFYLNALIKQGLTGVDTLQATEIVNNNYTELSPDNVTQDRVFELYKHIVWVTDNANLTLPLAQKTLNGFFNKGGTILMVSVFGSDWDSLSNSLSFTPISRLLPFPNGVTYRIIDNTTIYAVSSGWPDLVYSVSGAPLIRPFFKFENTPVYSYDYLYNTTIRVTGLGPSFDWKSADSTNIIVRRVKSGWGTDMIVSSASFEKMVGNAQFDVFFRKIVIDELKFQ